MPMTNCHCPKPQYKNRSPQPQHINQWYLLHWYFFHGIQTGYHDKNFDACWKLSQSLRTEIKTIRWYSSGFIAQQEEILFQEGRFSLGKRYKTRELTNSSFPNSKRLSTWENKNNTLQLQIPKINYTSLWIYYTEIFSVCKPSVNRLLWLYQFLINDDFINHICVTQHQFPNWWLIFYWL